MEYSEEERQKRTENWRSGGKWSGELKMKRMMMK